MMPDDAKPVPVPPFSSRLSFFSFFCKTAFPVLYMVRGWPTGNTVCSRGVVLYVRRKMALAAGQRQQQQKIIVVVVSVH
mgnify:CR=1 FL=1